MIPAMGALVVIGAVAAFWKLLPQKGQVHWLATAPVLESLIPLCIVAGFAMGGAMLLSAIVR